VWTAGRYSTGASGGSLKLEPRSDLGRATMLAEAMVECFGMGSQGAALRVARNDKGERDIVSSSQAEALNREISALISGAQKRAATILHTFEEDLLRLRDELQQNKIIEGDRIQEIIADFKQRHPETAAGFPPPEPKPDEAAHRPPAKG